MIEPGLALETAIISLNELNGAFAFATSMLLIQARWMIGAKSVSGWYGRFENTSSLYVLVFTQMV